METKKPKKKARTLGHTPKKTRKKSKRNPLFIFLGIIIVLAVLSYFLRYEIVQGIIDIPPVTRKTNEIIHETLMKEISSTLRQRIDLSTLQKAAVFVLRKRGEKEREQDAIRAVDRFISQELEEGRLGLIWACRLKRKDRDSYEKYLGIIGEYSMAVVWQDEPDRHDVCAAFSPKFKGELKVEDYLVNDDARFFKRIADVAGKAARD